MLQAERAGQLPSPKPTFSHLKPALFVEEDESVVVRLSVPSPTSSTQLKMRVDVNSLHVDLAGCPTAVGGHLGGLVKARLGDKKI